MRVVLALLSLQLAQLALAKKQLNVLLIVSDDLRTELGCYGGDAITPNLDALANRSGTTLFERSYVQQAICCPTRSSFLTGRRPDTTRVWDLHTQWRDAPGAAHWKSFPQVFREAGYVSTGMGKVFHPVSYKGQSNDLAGGSWSAYPQPVGPNEDSLHPLRKTNCGFKDANNTDADYFDGKTALMAAAVLRNQTARSAPFFLAVGFHRPHLPWVVPAKYFDL